MIGENKATTSSPFIAPAVTFSLPGKQDKFTCICCRIKFDSTDLQRTHFKTEWHLYNLKRRICSLEPLDLDSFNEIQIVSLKKKDDDDTLSNFSEISATNKPLDLSDDDWEEINNDELIDEDYDDLEIDHMLALAIKSNTCLFCDRENTNIKNNIDHMNLIHGFFIPENKYLIDLEGMMDYLGFKVGACATCLWCNKQFSTVHGVRLHMINKNHCKVLYDQEKATEEFKEFYDYSSQESFEMKPSNQLAIPLRRYQRRAKQNRNLARIRCFSDSEQTIKSRDNNYVSGSLQAKGIKKFNFYRAKLILRTESANNDTLRARLRRQNPI